jgi:predicted RNA binding protein YcfA (HicA-like mRNA interferase family)
LAEFPPLKASEAEALLAKNGFRLIRTKGSHRIYRKGGTRIIIPFHPQKNLHPKIVKALHLALEKESKS